MSITNIRRMLCLLLTFVAFEAAAQVKVEPGVSQELAQYRAKHVRDVTYDLSFKIPDKKIYGVEIEEEITFKWDGEGDLQLDFQGKLTYALIKNTRLDNSCYQDEHIVIPAKYLKKGRNRIKIQGGCSDKPLNRQDDYLYTLFVPDHARSAFACFDQPDIKAKYNLSLEMPDGWTAISNGALVHAKNQRMTFQTTEPIPT